VSEQDERDEQEQHDQFPGGAPDAGDAVDEDRLKWLASPEDEAAPAGSEVPPAEGGEGPVAGGPPPRRGMSVGTLIAGLAIVVLAGGAVFGWYTVQSANDALKATAISLASEAGTSPKEVTAKIDARNYVGATDDLKQLISMAVKPAPAGQQPAPAPNQEMPPDALKFFNAHPVLLRQWLALNQVGVAMREKGYDVTEFRAIKDQAIQAAAKGDEATVRQLAQRFADRVKMLHADDQSIISMLPTSGAPAQKHSPADLEKKLQEQVKAAVEKAAREGRDIRQAMQFIQESKDAAKQGDFDRSWDLLDSAIRAAEHAPRMKGQPGMMRRMVRRMVPGPGGRPGAGPLQALDLLMRMVQAETPELSKAYETLEDAHGAIREYNGQQIDEMIEEARATLKEIAERRHQVWLLLNQSMGRPGGPGGRPGQGGRPQPGVPQPTAHGPVPMPLPERIVGVMEAVRKMNGQQFEENKARVVQAIFMLFLPPEPAPSDVKPIPAAEADRIRAKLRLAAGPYFEAKAAGQDMEGIDKLFRDARTALYSGDTTQANKLVDEALMKLGLLQDISPTGPTVAPPG
jgi:hypothetical protein